MIKKNLWVAALLTALALTAFSIGCIEPLAEGPQDTATYTEVELKEFNAWGGNATNQAGWGTDGAKWDSGKKDVKSIGLSIEDLQAAKYLVVEVNDGFPKNNFETIWDGWDADGNKTGDWAQLSTITSAGGDLNPGFGTREGNVLKLEMAKIIKDYSTFRNKSTVAITLLIQHWGNGGTGACIKSAKLLISDEPVPYVAVGNVILPSNLSMYWTNELTLAPRILPEDATNQRIIWSIQKWVPSADNTDSSAVTADLANLGSDDFSTVKAALLDRVNWKQEEIILDDSVYPNETGTKNVPGVITAPSKRDSLGTVTIRATIKEGIEKDGSFKDYTKSFTFAILDPPPFTYKLAGAEKSTIFYGAVDNGGVSGGTLELTAAVEGKQTGYTVLFAPSGGQYGNSAHYIEVDLGSGKLSDYKGLRCHYVGVDGDSDITGKTVRLKAMAVRPPRSYNPGPNISTTKLAEGGNGKDADLDFEFFKDGGDIYGKGATTDLTTSTASDDLKANGGRYTDVDEDAKATVSVKDANIVYLWILPWAEGGAKFTISNIELYK